MIAPLQRSAIELPCLTEGKPPSDRDIAQMPSIVTALSATSSVSLTRSTISVRFLATTPHEMRVRAGSNRSRERLMSYGSLRSRTIKGNQPSSGPLACSWGSEGPSPSAAPTETIGQMAYGFGWGSAATTSRGIPTEWRNPLTEKRSRVNQPRAPLDSCADFIALINKLSSFPKVGVAPNRAQ